MYSPMRQLRTFLIALPFALPLAAVAQHVDEIPKVLNRTPQNVRVVLDRLATFSEFPQADWRYHAGDIPHGEDVNLDDKAWPVAKRQEVLGTDAVWMRRMVEIPTSLHGYDITGARILFRLVANSDSNVPEIVYFNGRRVALGEELEAVPLTESAKPGEKVLVAVKLMPTSSPKKFNSATLQIEFAADRPSPTDVRGELFSAQALIPVFSKDPAGDQKIIDAAAAAVDLKALDSNNGKKFDASLREAEQKLQPLRAMMQQLTFHVTGNSHIDAAWLWPWTETVDAVHRTFGSAAQLMNEYPDYTYTQSAAQYNEWMADKYASLDQDIQRRVKEGRWELVGGMWVEPDLNLPDGESLVRSILLGKRYYQKHYGVDVRIGWNPDSFGYNWQLPQIYKRSGIDYFVTQKMVWNDINQLPLKLFWWQSPDGSKVLTYFPHDYANRNLSPVRLSADLAAAGERAPGLTKMMDLYGVGDHGGGPTRQILDEGEHWKSTGKTVPTYEFGTAINYFKEITPKIAPDSKVWNYASLAAHYDYPPKPAEGQISIPTWNDELYLEYHRGVFTTQTAHKLGMRESEEQALNAEKYASLAWLRGFDYPNAALTDAWEKITFNGFHDLAAGSGIGVIYRDSHIDFEHVRRVTNEVKEGAVTKLDAGMDTRVKMGVPIVVWNPLAWKRGGIFTVDVQLPQAASGVALTTETGKRLPVEIVSHDASTHSFKLRVQIDEVPSMGYRVLSATPAAAPAAPATGSGLTLENAHLKVVIDPKSGCITSLYSKDAKTESITSGGCGNELVAYKDLPKQYDAWNIDPGTYDAAPLAISAPSEVKMLPSTTLRSAVQVTRHWGNSSFTQTVSLEPTAKYVTVDTDVDWHEKHVVLKASFPLQHSSANATYEIPYGSIQRPTTRNNSWEKARFEVPALRWADLGDDSFGFSLLNNSKYGYDAVNNLLRITLLRSPTSPDPDADQGMQHMTFRVMPHTASWQKAGTVREGYEFNYPLQATQATEHAGSMPKEMSFVSTDAPNVVVTALKKAEDSNSLILRLYESAGNAGNVSVKVPAGATAVSGVSMMENNADGDANATLSGSNVSLSVKPYQIVTLKLDYAPAR